MLLRRSLRPALRATVNTLCRAPTFGVAQSHSGRVRANLHTQPNPRTQRRFTSTTDAAAPSAEAEGQVQNDPIQEEEADENAMQYDVVVVGGGPAGLTAAIRLKQLAAEGGKEINVCVVEKGGEIGAHLLSGMCFEPRALQELFPDWKERGCPLETEVVHDYTYFLTEKGKIRLPTVPSQANHGNYLGSLGQFCKWLAEQAEGLGVEIYAGFAADAPVYNAKGQVIGIKTKDVGVGKDGSKRPTFEEGMKLLGKQVVLAEGARGHISQMLWEKFGSRANSDLPTYALGVKELWEIPKEKHKPGLVVHTLGWPLDTSTYGGSWMYHYGDNLVSIGLVVGLDYVNPWISPYKEFQRMKHHPYFKDILEGGTCTTYGGRTLWEGGIASMSKFTFPGGVYVGDNLGTINIAKIKGNHTAMKSAMLAAEGIYNDVFKNESTAEQSGIEATSYHKLFEQSWLKKELWGVRNYRQAFAKFGMWGGVLYSGISEYVTKGKESWTWKHPHSDYKSCKPAKSARRIEYPKPDGKLSFALLDNLSRSGTNHNADQPSHLVVIDEKGAQESWDELQGIETRFCPAGVYERVDNPKSGKADKLVINAQNCVHCKACDAKLPWLRWTVPEGGGGPKYNVM